MAINKIPIASDNDKQTNIKIIGDAPKKRIQHHNHMLNYQKIEDSIYKKCVLDDWDCPIAIVGDEGKGKTHFELWALDSYIPRIKGAPLEESDIKYLCLDREKWKEQLSQLDKQFPLAYDEAGELTNRRTMSKFNVEISQHFRVIRGNNNFLLLTIQDIFDLDPFFVKRRLKGMFYINKRGHYYFYSQARLRMLVDINSRFYVKNYFAVAPTCEGTYKKYDGILLKPYLKMKAEFLQAAKDKLKREVAKK